ncbi:MAG: hypothetical protein HQL90_10355 [Magnetococcales bacterium]|nr:hypothetical protein [Magnetococcales bacterium]
MTTLPGAIPAWNNAGVLPPIRTNAPGNSPDRSPYAVELAGLVDHFSSTPERIAILDGLLRFRADLHRAGIINGFQWLDGSFLEDVESLENRPPRDMDVVTFYHLPDGHNQRSLLKINPILFDRNAWKTSYKVDPYFISLGKPTDADRVKEISYWYSIWSHRRDGLWKGFVQVDLNPARDDAARAILNPDGGVNYE